MNVAVRLLVTRELFTCSGGGSEVNSLGAHGCVPSVNGPIDKSPCGSIRVGAGPGGPGDPCGPTSPGDPAGPAAPATPGGPVAPAGPCEPAGPAGPIAPGGPCGPTLLSSISSCGSWLV